MLPADEFPALLSSDRAAAYETNERTTMSRVSTYLNFMGNTEEAFTFYRSVFGTEFIGEIVRMKDMSAPGSELPEAERNLVAHVELPILGGHVIMATDMLESMGHECRIGNNVTINLEPDTREETERLYAALSGGGSESTGLQEMPFGYWGCSLDPYGIRWMFNCTAPKE
jgi:PhnB protein